MTYEYKCTHCGKIFDVIKSVKEIDVTEYCPGCGELAEKQFSFRVHIVGAKVQHAEFNPGLGCVVKNKHHREELCKQKGLIEVGNEKPESMEKYFEKQRQETYEKRWAED